MLSRHLIGEENIFLQGELNVCVNNSYHFLNHLYRFIQPIYDVPYFRPFLSVSMDAI
jgi:hypothetical protein